jgi:ribonuclease HI
VTTLTTKVTIFSDGSCLGNPGPGGWAALLVTLKDGERHERELIGGEDHTTNNRMELSAALEGLRVLKRPCAVEVVTDSNYLVKGMTEWMRGWIKRGWKNSKKQPVENRDLWEALLEASEDHDVKWTWVKAHAGHPENERVDDLARDEATRRQARP